MAEDLRTLPITAIREPHLPARSSMDDGALEELEASIRELGILQPLVVCELEDHTFEVLAGHRRLLAARKVGLSELPCVVRPRDARGFAVMVHENAFREDMNPVDEALLYAELYEELGQDTDRVATAVGRTREHVESRLLLLSGDEHVRDALHAGRIVLGVAVELNKCERPEDRERLLDWVARTGATIRQVRQWVAEENARPSYLAPPSSPSPVNGEAGKPGGPIVAPVPSFVATARPGELSSSLETRLCFFCDQPHPEWTMVRKYICDPCFKERVLPLEEERRRG